MQVVAEKRILEVSESGSATIKSAYLVNPGETVEDLLDRVGMTGDDLWHYSQMEVRLKLVRSPE